MKNLFKARWMTSLIFLIALFVITGIAAPGFLTYDNIVTSRVRYRYVIDTSTFPERA